MSEVVSFGRYPHRRRFAGPSAADRSAVDGAMAATGVREKAGRSVGELSGGEMQRVWLAACLAQDTGEHAVIRHERVGLCPQRLEGAEAAVQQKDRITFAGTPKSRQRRMPVWPRE